MMSREKRCATNSTGRPWPLDDCRSVCVLLGPYRNLTTLTAATLFLHPYCQVLNHAGGRIFDSNSDFIRWPTSKNIDQFVVQGTAMSAEGQRGDYGGSITYSHAFDAKHVMNEIHAAGANRLVKSRISSLVWKESLRVSKRLRAGHGRIRTLLNADKRVRFLMPIRNPLDCARSNLRTGHARHLEKCPASSTLTEVLDAVLDEFMWFFDCAEEDTTHRFFWFFEHSITEQKLIELQNFLELPGDSEWVRVALAAMDPKANYDHEQEVVGYYRNAVRARFKMRPAIRRELLRFVDS